MTSEDLTKAQKEGIRKHREEQGLLCRRVLEKEAAKKEALSEKRRQSKRKTKK